MGNNAFLTDRRREFLEGDYDLDTSKDRQLKHKIKNDAESALSELVEVAESPHIDTREVFDQDEVFRLLDAIMAPDPMYVDGGGLVGGDLDQNRPAVANVDDEFNAYTDRLYVQLDKLMRPYRDERFPPYESGE